MFVSTSSLPTTVAEVSVEPGAAPAVPVRTIGQRELERAHVWFRTLRELGSDEINALLALHEYLSVGGSQIYEDLLRSAAPRAPSSRSAVSASQQPKPALLTKDSSWPEKVLTLEKCGLKSKLTIGMPEDLFREKSFQGVMNRGHEQLAPSTLALMPLPRTGPKDWKQQLFTKVFSPAINALKSGQTALVYPPSAGALLVGKDERGELFGVSTECWNSRFPVQRNYVLKERALTDALDRARLMPSGPSNWLLLTPSQDPHA